MENETINLTNLICDSLNSIFYKIFSSIDNTIYSNLDHILFINTDILKDSKFQKLFGTDTTNGLLLIANALIFGIILFYIFKFAISHLTYSKVDSPYQFAFKCIIFIACMNSSLWICEGLIYFISLISNSICEIGNFITGYEVNFSNLINHMNSYLYPSIELFNIFSFEGFLKLCSTIGIIYILLNLSVRFILCKIFVLLAPFACISLISNHFDGFFKGWLKQILILLSMQIFISILLVLGFTLEIYVGDILSKLTYFAIILVIAKCNFYVKNLFLHIYEYSHNQLKNFV